MYKINLLTYTYIDFIVPRFVPLSKRFAVDESATLMNGKYN